MELVTDISPLDFDRSVGPLPAVLAHLENLESEDTRVLRWGLLGLQGSTALLEVAMVSGAQKGIGPWVTPERKIAASPPGTHVCMVVPTGVGASIGGFIGDAGAVARLLGGVADTLILHPNVANGADLYGAPESALYVDGFTLDRFFDGEVCLAPASKTRVGLVIDRVNPSSQTRIVNACNATMVVMGVDVVGFAVCEEKVQAETVRSPHGHFIGHVSNPEVLLEAAEKVALAGAEAVAVVTSIGGVRQEDLVAHYSGLAPNPVGAVEALISRAITLATGVPCAHAPISATEVAPSEAVDPRAAAELVSGTSVPCTLQGLARSPILCGSGGISARQLSAVVVPFDCAGGMPAVAASKYDVPMVAVRSNRCRVGVSAPDAHVANSVVVENYAEAAAFVAARRAGVSWQSIAGPLRGLEPVRAYEREATEG